MVKVRRALPADAEGIAGVHAATGLDAYRGFLPIETLDNPERLPRRIEHWREVLDRLGDQTHGTVEAMWVAADTDEPDTVLGFIHACPSGDDDAGDDAGEITTFYVSTERQGERIGERLLDRAIDHLLSSGCRDLRLWTLEGNEKAQRYYANRGWRADGATRPVPTDEYEAKEVRFRTDLPSLDARTPSRSILPMVDALLPQPLDDGRYLADAPGWWGGDRVFGGAVVAQVATAAALAAGEAGGAGEGARAHSLHTHFLRAVRPGAVELRTEPIRIGRTFTTIRVDSVQDGRIAATSIVSFHADEPDVPYQLAMPDVPRPHELPVEDDPGPSPFDERWIGPTEPRPDGTYESTRRCWIRASEDLPDDPIASLLVLAYLSDMTGTGFRPYNLDEWGTHTDASIDHAVWFHRPPDASQWLYADFHALINAAGRSTVRGVYYDESGDLVLSMAQELLIRPL